MTKINRRKMLKVSASTLGILATGGLFSTSYAKPSRDIRTQIDIFNFGGEAQQEHQKRIYKKFNEEYPNVKINDIYKPWP